MARTFSLTWGGFSNGEDSVTDAVDPLSIPNGRCSRLENLIPSSGRLRPRDGSRWVAGTTDLWWMEQYEELSGGWGILVDSGDLIAQSVNGGRYLLREGWLQSPCAISSVRVGKYLILLPDAEGKALVIYRKKGAFEVIPAYLANSGVSPISEFEAGTAETESSINWSYDEDLSEIPETYGDWETGLPRVITYTWTRIEGQDGVTFDMSTGMPAAQLESWEDAGARTSLNYNHLAIDGVGSSGLTGKLRVLLSGTPPEDATHLRLYMTLPGTISEGNYENAQLIANGLVLRWVADVPVSMIGSYYEIQGNDGALAGSTNLCWSTGRDDIPPGSKVLFAGGRLWVAGGTTEVNPGRAYFSAIADGSTDQLARLLSFSYQADFVDTSTDETQPMVGMGLSQGNLIFFNTRSVWALASASPDNYPECISSSRGAVGGITEIGQRIFYISQDGPAAVSGSVVDLLVNFKSAFAWPKIKDQSQFFIPGRRIRGWWHSGHWMTSDGQFVACFRLDDDGGTGTWRLSTNVAMSFMCSCSPAKGVTWVGGGSQGIFSLMEPGRTKDGEGWAGAAPFTARLITNGTPVPQGVVTGEAFSIRTLTRWVDSGSQLKISLMGDYGRVADLYQFEDTTDHGATGVVSQVERGAITQPVVHGALSHWFQVGLEKNIWGKTLFGPIELRCLKRNYDTEGWSLADAGRAEPILDSGIITWDPEVTEI